MAQGIAGAFLVRIPVSFLMSRIQPVSLFLVGLATPAPLWFKSCCAPVIFICLAGNAERPVLSKPRAIVSIKKLAAKQCGKLFYFFTVLSFC